MDCRTAREWMATAVAGALEPSEAVQTHLSQCSSCRTEFEAWSRTWSLLGTWADTEPPTKLDRAILAEMRAATETSRSWLRRLATGRVWATAAAAAVVAIAASLFVPYQESLRVCGKVLADVGIAPPPLVLSFLVGFPYAFLPLLVVALLWTYLRTNGRTTHAATVGQAFAIIIVPYIFLACADLEGGVIAGILLGTVTGAFLGGGISQWLIRHRPAGVPA